MLTLRSLILLLCQTPIVQLYPEAAAQIWLVPLKIIFFVSNVSIETCFWRILDAAQIH